MGCEVAVRSGLVKKHRRLRDVSKRLTLSFPAATGRVQVTFEFYKFDSWDNTAAWGFDRFEIDVDGTKIFSLPFGANQSARSGMTDVRFTIRARIN